MIEEGLVEIGNAPCCKSHHIEKKQRRQIDLHGSIDTAKSLNELSEDLLLYIMRFIISESGNVDGMTFRNISVVCHQWYKLVNTPLLWTTKTVDTTSTSIARSLIGYRKIDQPTNLWKNNLTYRVVDRARNEVYLVRVVEKSSAETLCHLAHTNEMSGGTAILEASQEIKAAFLLPIHVEIPKMSDRMLLWYENCEQNLRHWIDTIETSVNTPLTLPISMTQLKVWTRQLLQALIHLQNQLFLPCCPTWIKPENIFMDQGSSRLKIMLPEVASRNHWQSNHDLFCLGHVFAHIVRFGKDASVAPTEETSFVSWLHNQFPSLDELGVDFLRTLVEHRIRSQAFPRPKKYTLEQILNHPFLSLEHCDSSVPYSNVSILQRKVLLEEPVRIQRRLIGNYEWAAIVDWVAEVCIVFEVGRLAMFRAMSYFDRIIAEASRPFPPSRYQMLAAACLLVASKVTGNAALTPTDVANCADNSFDAEGLLVYEQYILEKLNWQLMSPTILEFTMMISDVSDGSSPRESAIHDCVAVSAMQTGLYRTFSPSMIAAAVSVVAMYCMERQVWDVRKEKETGFSLTDVQAPVSCLCAEVHRIAAHMTDLKTITRAYSVEDFGARSIPRVLDLQQHYQQ